MIFSVNGKDLMDTIEGKQHNNNKKNNKQMNAGKILKWERVKKNLGIRN